MVSCMSEETVTGSTLQYLTRKTVSLNYSISLKKELHLWLIFSCKEALEEAASIQELKTSELSNNFDFF